MSSTTEVQKPHGEGQSRTDTGQPSSALMIPVADRWVCDTCKQVIEGAENGFLEWLYDQDHKYYGFRIIHHKPKSPRAKGCSLYENEPKRMDDHLDHFVGEDGWAVVLSLIDDGVFIHRDYPGPEVKDLREWTELMRRLFIPDYDLARAYYPEAEAEGLFEGNELTPYLGETIALVLEEYDEKDDEGGGVDSQKSPGS